MGNTRLSDGMVLGAPKIPEMVRRLPLAVKRAEEAAKVVKAALLEHGFGDVVSEIQIEKVKHDFLGHAYRVYFDAPPIEGDEVGEHHGKGS